MKSFTLLVATLLVMSPPVFADPASEIEAWNDEFFAAWNAKDADRVAMLFTEDVDIVWQYAEEEAYGRQEFIELLKWEFSYPGKLEVDQVSRKIRELPDGSYLVLEFSNQTFPDNSGNPMTIRVRATSLYQRVGDRLVVSLDHASIAQPWEEPGD